VFGKLLEFSAGKLRVLGSENKSTAENCAAKGEAKIYVQAHNESTGEN
jgi:hypothetical protein